MRAIGHEVPVRKTVVMHVVCELGLVLAYLIEFGSHLVSIGVSSTNLPTKDVSTLSGSSWLSLGSSNVIASMSSNSLVI